jgi:UV DNA damage endonuclease
MNIGYACLALGVPGTDFRRCMQKNANDERLIELIAHNLNSLETIFDYNIKNKIKLFRISSDLIPFASSPVNMLPWWDLFEIQLSLIGDKLKMGGLRVSMHPGQYTVLNSPDESVVKRAVDDLNYHAKVLDALKTGPESKIVLHVGGIYGDKVQAIKRFKENYLSLDPSIKKRLVIENDDKAYTIEDVVRIGNDLGIPVVFDNLHHRVNPPKNVSDEVIADEYTWIAKAGKTWKDADGRQKIHYSQQEPMKRQGAHSATIHTDEFLVFYHSIKMKKIDVMLEVKDKNLSAVKCLGLLQGFGCHQKLICED